MRRFDSAIAGLAAEQDRIARAAQRRTWLGWLGSLTIGSADSKVNLTQDQRTELDSSSTSLLPKKP